MVNDYRESELLRVEMQATVKVADVHNREVQAQIRVFAIQPKP